MPGSLATKQLKTPVRCNETWAGCTQAGRLVNDRQVRQPIILFGQNTIKNVLSFVQTINCLQPYSYCHHFTEDPASPNSRLTTHLDDILIDSTSGSHN